MTKAHITVCPTCGTSLRVEQDGSWFRCACGASWTEARDTEAELCAEFQAYCDAQGLPQMSADELIHETLTAEQRKYISAFIIRWDAMVDDYYVHQRG